MIVLPARIFRDTPKLFRCAATVKQKKERQRKENCCLEAGIFWVKPGGFRVQGKNFLGRARKFLG
jgi:hypothetical protein